MYIHVRFVVWIWCIVSRNGRCRCRSRVVDAENVAKTQYNSTLATFELDGLGVGPTALYTLIFKSEAT